ncbi:hypothetical protein ACFW9F_16960 [Streptomyces sp. NPDC059506]|uniref:hypothetical protein n=1 Tax=Streptomyces sp. NPDC059506 TaxID=3347751 RepID=UPI0036B87A5D
MYIPSAVTPPNEVAGCASERSTLPQVQAALALLRAADAPLAPAADAGAQPAGTGVVVVPHYDDRLGRDERLGVQVLYRIDGLDHEPARRRVQTSRTERNRVLFSVSAPALRAGGWEVEEIWALNARTDQLLHLLAYPPGYDRARHYADQAEQLLPRGKAFAMTVNGSHDSLLKDLHGISRHTAVATVALALRTGAQILPGRDECSIRLTPTRVTPGAQLRAEDLDVVVS